MACTRGAMAPDPRGPRVYRFPYESGRRARQICRLDRTAPTRNQSSAYPDGLRETLADRLIRQVLKPTLLKIVRPPRRFRPARFLRKCIYKRAVWNLVGLTAGRTGRCDSGCSLYGHLRKDRDEPEISKRGRNLDIKLLKTFLALADERSFTAAGKLLGLTQSAVSQQIRVLERELGAELVIRSNKLVGLTPAGEILRQSAHRILENLDQARSLIAERSSNGGGRLSVGAPTSVCRTLMPVVATAFHTRFPATDLSIITLDQANAIERLTRRDVDF